MLLRLPNREPVQLLLDQPADIDYDSDVVQPADPREEVGHKVERTHHIEQAGDYLQIGPHGILFVAAGSHGTQIN